MDFLVSDTLCLEDLRAQGRWKLIRKSIVRRFLKRIKDFLKEKTYCYLGLSSNKELHTKNFPLQRIIPCN